MFKPELADCAGGGVAVFTGAVPGGLRGKGREKLGGARDCEAEGDVEDALALSLVEMFSISRS
jgi:hypothetical protein